MKLTIRANMGVCALVNDVTALVGESVPGCNRTKWVLREKATSFTGSERERDRQDTPADEPNDDEYRQQLALHRAATAEQKIAASAADLDRTRRLLRTGLAAQQDLVQQKNEQRNLLTFKMREAKFEAANQRHGASLLKPRELRYERDRACDILDDPAHMCHELADAQDRVRQLSNEGPVETSSPRKKPVRSWGTLQINKMPAISKLYYSSMLASQWSSSNITGLPQPGKHQQHPGPIHTLLSASRYQLTPKLAVPHWPILPAQHMHLQYPRRSLISGRSAYRLRLPVAITWGAGEIGSSICTLSASIPVVLVKYIKWVNY
ncbi:hypothetical protein COCSUDRAFT_45653 [Coccomyxa subellipsoidea C-169]|uniref:Uncharacterized protein n=1 Tax=Coccomyxa subellipsoidea (strain C-169) TaxID=574566 RepID=I0YI06_COCSC|nr:hypothetical protein COCSUDRAFT_45653 [Coccomyxa subellipsoidea C-169]EIE18025.1 hypothetical protein COCSUDRAFT_45653 [Coccomyxa subellipsoidea C-169]|eukprot:XP_005642569.1 hypothetical protein COCSUDRAFT_45653 [Coccomyxa subellipsoidea C-169]